jgi:hypothetical protein
MFYNMTQAGRSSCRLVTQLCRRRRFIWRHLLSHIWLYNWMQITLGLRSTPGRAGAGTASHPTPRVAMTTSGWGPTREDDVPLCVPDGHHVATPAAATQPKGASARTVSRRRGAASRDLAGPAAEKTS